MHAYGLMLAVLSVIAALAFFADPTARERSAVGQAVHPLDDAWNVMYLAGGLLVALGILAVRPRFELAGISLLSAAIVINGLAVVFALLARARIIVAGEPGQTIVVANRKHAE